VRWAAVGVAVVALTGAWFWWSRGTDASGCPRMFGRARPATVDEASQLIAVCGPEEVRIRLRTASLPDLVGYRSAQLPPAAWLAPDSALHRQLTGLGFEYPDDMSFAVLSAAWHRARGLSFEAKATADCLRAWNRKMRQWVDTVPPGSSVPAPEFGCMTPEEIEKGRHLWSKE